MTDLEKILYNTITGTLSVGGGILGNVPGAGLGYAGGRSIEEFAKAMQGEKADVFGGVKAIPEGMAQEMGGQIIGKTIKPIITKMMPMKKESDALAQALVNSLKRDNKGQLIKESHGSNMIVSDPKPIARTGIGGDNVFHTTPQDEIAEMFARYSQLKHGEYDGMPSVVNKYYVTKNSPTITLDRKNIYEVANKIGLNQEEAEVAMQGALKEAPKSPMGRLYNQMLRQLAMKQDIPLTIREAGQLAAEKLQGHGYNRLQKDLDLGGQEILNWNPEQSLVYAPKADKALAAMEEMKQNIIDNNLSKLLADKMSNLIGNTSTRLDISKE